MQVTIEDVQAQGGGTAQFQAVIEGNPQPTVTWYKVEMVWWAPCVWRESVKSPRTWHVAPGRQGGPQGWAPGLG